MQRYLILEDMNRTMSWLLVWMITQEEMNRQSYPGPPRGRVWCHLSDFAARVGCLLSMTVNENSQCLPRLNVSETGIEWALYKN